MNTDPKTAAEEALRDLSELCKFDGASARMCRIITNLRTLAALEAENAKLREELASLRAKVREAQAIFDNSDADEAWWYADKLRELTGSLLGGGEGPCR